MAAVAGIVVAIVVSAARPPISASTDLPQVRDLLCPDTLSIATDDPEHVPE